MTLLKMIFEIKKCETNSQFSLIDMGQALIDTCILTKSLAENINRPWVFHKFAELNRKSCLVEKSSDSDQFFSIESENSVLMYFVFRKKGL